MSNSTANIQNRVNIPAIKTLPPLSDSIKKINAQVKPQQPAPVQPVAPPPQPVQSAPQPQVAQQEIPKAIEQVEELKEMEIVQAETYLSAGSKDQGYVEFDLMSYRQKGQEVRYLQIQIQGFSVDDKDKGKANNTCMAITTKEDFERVKGFFSTLKWED